MTTNSSESESNDGIIQAKPFRFTPEQTALCYAGIFLLSGVALTILLYQYGIKDSPTIIALLIVPLLVYGVASGKILELSGPGGWGAKFNEVAEQKALITATPISEEMRELQPVEKESLVKLQQILPKLQKKKPVALILFFGRTDYQVLAIVQEYFNQLSRVDPQTVIVIVDNQSRKFVCMIEGEEFAELIQHDGQSFISAINSGDKTYLRRINDQRQSAVVIFKALSKNSTNADALREMRNLGVKTLVVLDDYGKPESLVRRDEIMSHLFDEITAIS
jgi:hypothetical protein